MPERKGLCRNAKGYAGTQRAMPERKGLKADHVVQKIEQLENFRKKMEKK